MNAEEANKIITEYMYPEFKVMEYIPASYQKCLYYCQSLDGLVPVWEQLGNVVQDVHIERCYIKPSVELQSITGHIYYSQRSTIQEAACIATAEAIQEVDNGK